MSLKTPDVGSLRVNCIEGDEAMYWGDNTKILGEVDNRAIYQVDPLTGKTGKTTYAMTPSTAQVLTENFLNYIDKSDNSYPINYKNAYRNKGLNIGLSPYGSNSDKFFEGCLSNLRGKEINELILSKVTAHWQEGEIENSVASGHCPTVCSCRRYYTKGTQAGDWYLPTIGELGIMWARLKEINDSLDLIGFGDAISIGGMKQYYISSNNFRTYGYWLHTCIEYDQSQSRHWRTTDGYSDRAVKNSTDASRSRTRAFLAV